jgi:hypothetical protein
MFEKEAEEYFETECLHSYADTEEQLKEDVIPAFQKGAEFGYNKANEWHYVKDELPPIKKEYNGRSEPVLVLSKEKEMQYAQYVEKEKTWARGICKINFEPYAWKEIVLPKECV